MDLSKCAGRLKDWLDENDKNQQWLAERLTEARGGERVWQASVSMWLRGSQIPQWAAFGVQKVTGIPAADWTVRADESGHSLTKRRRHRRAG